MTAVEALAGAVVGSLITGGFWVGRYFLTEHREKEQLERMFHTELSHMDIFRDLDEIPMKKFPDPSAFPTIIFESNAGKMGILEQEHRHSLHAFYSYLDITKTMMRQEIESSEENIDTREKIRYNLDSLRERREILLSELEQ
ncbi:hypothetical protein [Halorubrum sp. Hd13]|uniref:hypothetical protein n=1 Tax=Halorubrum sp. Hd13 TaxID=1480728 RepID=UPI0011402FE4|nr:hypothetical protein [Halorubrum sp. Hd13]